MDFSFAWGRHRVPVVWGIMRDSAYQRVTNISLPPHHTPAPGVALFDPGVPITATGHWTPKEVLQQHLRPVLVHNDGSKTTDHRSNTSIASYISDCQGSSHAETVKRIYEKILSTVIYGKPIVGLYPAEEALRGPVDCGGFSTLLSAALHQTGVRNRLVVGFVLKQLSFWRKMLVAGKIIHLTKAHFSMHVWVEIEQIAGLPPFPLDPSVEWRRLHGMSTRKGGFGHVAADRLVVSYGHNHTIIHNTIPYVLPLIQFPVGLGEGGHTYEIC